MQEKRGQAIVIVAFALVVLLAFAGLAVDGGRAYTARRQTQNAADAGVVAATRKLAEMIAGCDSGSVDNDNIVAQALVDLARHNGVDHFSPDANIKAWYVDSETNRLGEVGVGGGIPNNAAGVEAQMTVTDTATFMRVLGRDHIGASANATAMTGPVRQFSGGGMLPIGVPVQRVDAIIDSGSNDFTIFDSTGAICSTGDVDCPSDPPAQASRGWLNFNYIYNAEINAGGSTSDPRNRVLSTSMSNADLKEWAENGSPHPLYAGTRGGLPPYLLDGDFIAGQPGSRESSRKTVCDNHMGKTAYMPIFDYVEQAAFMNSNFDSPASPLSFPSGQFLHYHVVGFVAATINDCGGKTIGGEFHSAVIGAGPINPSSGIGSTCTEGIVMGVVLWK